MQTTQLTSLADQLLTEARSAHSGRSARSLFGHHDHRLRQTVIALAAGHKLAEHSSPGEATLQVLSGRVTLQTPTQSWTGADGDHVVISDERHELVAMTDAAVLLTVVVARG